METCDNVCDVPSKYCFTYLITPKIKCGRGQYLHRCAGRQFLADDGKTEVRAQRESAGKLSNRPNPHMTNDKITKQQK